MLYVKDGLGYIGEVMWSNGGSATVARFEDLDTVLKAGVISMRDIVLCLTNAADGLLYNRRSQLSSVTQPLTVMLTAACRLGH